MAAESTEPKEQIVDPWTAQAGEGEKKINYDKLIGKLIRPNQYYGLQGLNDLYYGRGL